VTVLLNKQGKLSYGSRFLRDAKRLGATDAWDFVDARWLRAGRVTSDPGLTVTRASSGYAETSDGRLVEFGSGVLRRTDKGVLVEGARTNLLTYSQEFDDASWAKVNATVTANATTAPDGTSTADLLVANTASAQHRLDQTTTIAAAAHTYSVFLKAGGYNFANIRVGSVGVGINLSDGTTNTLSAGCSVLVTALANGWYRLALTCTALGNDTVRINVTDTATVAGSFTGDGTSGVYVWGAQLEAASFASSYVKSEAAAATRAADVVTAVPTSGTDYPLSLYAEFERVVDTGGVEHIYQIDNGTDTEAAVIRVNSSDQANVRQIVNNVEVANVSVAGAMGLATIYKIAARIQEDNVRIVRDGNLSSVDTSAPVPVTPTTVRFGRTTTTGSMFFNYIRRAAIIPRALIDAELQGITT
jgi:hypothetical protein